MLEKLYAETSKDEQIAPTPFKETDDSTKKIIYERIRFLRNLDNRSTYKQCILQILEEFDVSIGRHNVYSATKDNELAVQEEDIIISITGPTKKFSDINEETKKRVNKKILDMRTEDAKLNTYERCINIIQEEFNVEIKRHNVYNAVKTNNNISTGYRIRRSSSSSRRRSKKKKSIQARPRYLETEYGNLVYYIHNVVFSGTTNVPIEIEDFVNRYEDATYNPRRFPGIVLRLEKPRATVLLFKTGKFVIVGLKEESDIIGVKRALYEKLSQAGLDASEDLIFADVNNIVITTTLPHEENLSIDLNRLSIMLENCMYEPEVFPGLMYRHEDVDIEEGKAVFLIFSTGKVVCVGIKKANIISGILRGFLKKITAVKTSVFIDNNKPKIKIKLDLNV